MQAEIICIGTELLLGKIINTNASYLARVLSGLGIDLFYQTTVGDNKIRLLTALKRAMHRSDLVIITGGLGPTVDDITLETIVLATQKKPVLNSQVLKEIKSHFQKRHIPMPKSNLRQALIPQGATCLKNEVGTAPGLMISVDQKLLIALPGVPQEMKPMIERDVIPYLSKNFAPEAVIISQNIRTTGLAESQVNQKVQDLLKLKPPLTVGIYAHTEGVDLTITAKAKSKQQAQRQINAVVRKIRMRLKEFIYAEGNQTLEEVVSLLLHKNRYTVTVAESCTAGLISKRLTDVSGSSRYFTLGLIAYSNQAKQSLLKVPPASIREFGAVSKQVAQIMAQNIKDIANTNLGLGITGIAGPTGATKEKPVGLVHIALATPRKVITQEFYFHGDRAAIRQRASQAALDMLRRFLK